MRAFLINNMYIMSDQSPERPGLCYLRHVTQHNTAQPVGCFHLARGVLSPDPEDADQLFEE